MDFFLGRVPGWSSGALIVMKDYHDQEPVPTAQVQDDPGDSVGVNDRGNHKHVNNEHHGGSEDDNQAHKHHSEPSCDIVHYPVYGLEHTVEERIRVTQAVVVKRLEQDFGVAP